MVLRGGVPVFVEVPFQIFAIFLVGFDEYCLLSTWFERSRCRCAYVAEGHGLLSLCIVIRPR